MFTSTLQTRIQHVGVGWPRSSLVDPGSQHADLLRTQPLHVIRWHDVVGIETRDAMHKRARQAVTWHENGAVFAPFHHARLDPEIQAALFIASRVALEAVLAKNRLHLFDEIDGSPNGGRHTVRQLERIAKPACAGLLRIARSRRVVEMRHLREGGVSGDRQCDEKEQQAHRALHGNTEQKGDGLE